MSVQSDPWIGSVLAGYRLERLLGRGGMGVVYLAHDERLDRKVALKLLSPVLAEDRGFRERFLRESRLAASLDHENVIPIYQAGEHEGRLFIAMRYVECTDLGALLHEQGPLEPGRAIAILAQVASALDADEQTREVAASIPVGRRPNGVAFGAGSVWVANYDDGTVSRVDPATNQVVSTIEVGPSPDVLAFGEGALWVAVHAG